MNATLTPEERAAALRQGINMIDYEYEGSVEWSVHEANRERGNRTIEMQHPCACGANEWRVLNGIDPKYKSQYNPGEYCRFTCIKCGYSFEEQS